MNPGIISQYGFLYQRLFYFMTIFENANTNLNFTYEGKDDIDVLTNESISMICLSNEMCIQVKSGNVTKETFHKIIGNWILLYEKNISYRVVLENKIDFSVDLESFMNWVENGKDKKKNAISKRAYELYSSNKEDFETKANNILKNYTMDVFSISDIELKIKERFFNDYCGDIVEYEMAKEKRCEMILRLLNDEIDSAVKSKSPCVISYAKLMTKISFVNDAVNDNNYEIDVKVLKKSLMNNAEKIVQENNTREVEQLKLVNDRNEFIISEIVNELMYKDFRDVYFENKNMQISNIEQIAKTNFLNILYSLSPDANPNEIFNQTMKTNIDSEIMPKGPMYNRGCYTYLTGEDIEEDLQITWSEKNE